MKELTKISFIVSRDLVIGSWPPAIWRRLAEAVDQSFCKHIKRHGVEAARMGMVAALANTCCQI